MNRQTAQNRRKTIRALIMAEHPGFMRTTEDWYRIVANRWPGGWSNSPCLNTVKSELIAMTNEGLMKNKTIVKGWFVQERWSVCRTEN